MPESSAGRPQTAQEQVFPGRMGNRLVVPGKDHVAVVVVRHLETVGGAPVLASSLGRTWQAKAAVRPGTVRAVALHPLQVSQGSGDWEKIQQLAHPQPLAPKPLGHASRRQIEMDAGPAAFALAPRHRDRGSSPPSPPSSAVSKGSRSIPSWTPSPRGHSANKG